MAAPPHHNGSTETRQILLYFGLLTSLADLVSPNNPLLSIPTSYILKNQLHATAAQVSTFQLLVSIPIYFGFGFGLIRDRWNPFGLRDRGFFLIFGPLTALAFIWMALSHLSYQGLVIGMLAATLSFQFIAGAFQGLISLVGQENFMTGRLRALWNTLSSLAAVSAAFASGYVSEHMPRTQTFLLMTALACLIAILGLWRPRAVFAHTYERSRTGDKDIVADVRRLVKHRAIYPVVLIFFLWEFMPGAGTPLQFHLTNDLHGSDATYSYYTGIDGTSLLLTTALYGYFCRKVPLGKLLWWGAIVGVPSMIPLAFIHSSRLALLVAVPIGLMTGFCTAAYFDLLMRSCPRGLQGTLTMLVVSVATASSNAGDVLGSFIYTSSPAHGFLYCVIAMTLVYALILPVLRSVPKKLVATGEGEWNDVEADASASIAETGTA